MSGSRTGVQGSYLRNIPTLYGSVSNFTDTVYTSPVPDASHGIATIMSGMGILNGENDGIGLWTKAYIRASDLTCVWGIYGNSTIASIAAPIFGVTQLEGGTSTSIEMNLTEGNWNVQTLSVTGVNCAFAVSGDVTTLCGIGSSVHGAGAPLMQRTGVGALSIENFLGDINTKGLTLSSMGLFLWDGQGDIDPGEDFRFLTVLDEDYDVRWSISNALVINIDSSKVFTVDNISAIVAPTKSLRIRIDGVNYYLPLSTAITPDP